MPALVFEFRRLAALLVTTMNRPLVIGIDELDKVGDREVVRQLLQGVGGVLEIPNVHFLVAVSEDAAAALQLGPLQVRGRNEFNSAFSAVISLPPLSAEQATALLGVLGIEVTAERAQILCLLSAGNLRELIRLADESRRPARPDGTDPNHWLIMKALEAEATALLGEIIYIYAAHDGAGDVMVSVWNKLPYAAFSTVDGFVELSQRYSRALAAQLGRPHLGRPHKRVVAAAARPDFRFRERHRPIADHRRSAEIFSADMAGLRDVLIMATQSSAVAKAMLQAGSGPNLDRTYSAPSGIRLLPDSVG